MNRLHRLSTLRMATLKYSRTSPSICHVAKRHLFYNLVHEKINNQQKANDFYFARLQDANATSRASNLLSEMD